MMYVQKWFVQELHIKRIILVNHVWLIALLAQMEVHAVCVLDQIEISIIAVIVITVSMNPLEIVWLVSVAALDVLQDQIANNVQEVIVIPQIVADVTMASMNNQEIVWLVSVVALGVPQVRIAPNVQEVIVIPPIVAGVIQDITNN